MNSTPPNRVAGERKCGRGSIPCQEALLTDSAFEAGECSERSMRLECGLESLAFETGLAEVLRGTWCSWRTFSGRYGGSLALIRTKAVPDLDEAVFAPVIEGLFQFSNLLQGLQVFLLFPEQLTLESEETVLSLQDLIVELADNCRHLVEIANGHGRLTEISREAQRCCGGTNKRKVHGNPPDSGFVDCGDHDSTAGADSHHFLGRRA